VARVTDPTEVGLRSDVRLADCLEVITAHLRGDDVYPDQIKFLWRLSNIYNKRLIITKEAT
jgi:hypothetical protein